jgi:hypothetical protein
LIFIAENESSLLFKMAVALTKSFSAVLKTSPSAAHGELEAVISFLTQIHTMFII